MKKPTIGKKTYVHKNAVLTGDVYLGKEIFIAPTAVLRADEPGSKIIVADGCNIQDGAIIHSLANSTVEIGDHVSLAHGCIVHGPCSIGKKSFIGFRSIVFNSHLAEGVIVMHGAIVEGVSISSRRLIPTGRLVDTQVKADKLQTVSEKEIKFAADVATINAVLREKYLKEALVD